MKTKQIALNKQDIGKESRGECKNGTARCNSRATCVRISAPKMVPLEQAESLHIIVSPLSLPFDLQSPVTLCSFAAIEYCCNCFDCFSVPSAGIDIDMSV